MSENSQNIPNANISADIDPIETREWMDALAALIEHTGKERAYFLLDQLITEAKQKGITMPSAITTPYINTIPTEKEKKSPGDLWLEKRLRAYLRWNAMAMVVKANRLKPKDGGDLGGHISSYTSLATMLETGFNHFWKADKGNGGDLLYIQGHSAPGIYARAFVEGRITEEQLLNFRQEVDGKGLSSYPHPKLMHDFWQFPTVSMGLGPMMAIYQARFLKYLQARGIAETAGRKVWVFLGDGEMDEPESRGAIAIAAREKLDNLVFVVNCNLQRLDGPVRGNEKIVQELEGQFKGAGWNVIKLLWGNRWDSLLARDTEVALRDLMMKTNDGEYQAYKARDGAYVREHFFGKDPRTLKMVEHMTDDEIWALNRGGHDAQKVYAAFAEADTYVGLPTLLLVKTIKGYGMGHSAEGRNIAHQVKKLTDEDIKYIRDRFDIPVPDDKISELPFIKPADDSPEMKYLHERRKALGGYLPERRAVSDEKFTVPTLDTFKPILDASTEGHTTSTTQAFVRFLNLLLRDKELGPRVVPILVDEARTFGMEGLFRQIGIYNPKGQQYTPVDRDELMYYREDQAGQILQEGINEAGGMCSWIAAATSYSTNNKIMMPFYVFYSMFGMQRIGDFAWAAGDMQARGFLLGGTSGRTTLNGEGLQHEDGHSLLLSSTIPNCVSYDPAYAHEVAVIMHDGLKRMVEKQENIYYYITLLNESYVQPGLNKGDEADILKGMYLLESGKSPKKGAPIVNLMGSGSIMNESVEAKKLLEQDWGVGANLWSCPSFTELAREGREVERWNMLNPQEKAKVPFVATKLQKHTGPIVVSTDYVRAYPEQIRAYIPKGQSFTVLGTDGYGRSDFRIKLREHFEINRYFIVIAVLKALADEGKIDKGDIAKAIKKYKIDVSKADPLYA